jgi:hypothetical protein
MPRTLRVVPDTVTGDHPTWCDPTKATYDVHHQGPGFHASKPRVLLEVPGFVPITGAIYQDAGAEPQILLGLNTYATLAEVRSYAAALAALVAEAEAA